MSKPAQPQGYGFVKLIRSSETPELMQDPFAFVLLAQIAYRARWRGALNRHDLQIGEALIGDHDSIGLTEQQYREAKKRLTKYGKATFHTTNRGTIARLTDASVFDLNLYNNEPTTSKQRPTQRPDSPLKTEAEQRPTQRSNNNPPTSQQRLTKNEIKKEENNNDESSGELSADYWPQHYESLSEARKDSRWKNFSAYCKQKGGEPAHKGFNTWLKKQSLLKGRQIQHGGNGSAKYQDALIASMHRGDIENEVPIASRRSPDEYHCPAKPAIARSAHSQ